MKILNTLNIPPILLTLYHIVAVLIIILGIIFLIKYNILPITEGVSLISGFIGLLIPTTYKK